MLFLFYDHTRQYLYLSGSALVIGLLGLGMFESTAIQFGMDQMLEATSEQFSTFIHWYYWFSYLGRPIIVYLYKGVMAYFDRCNYVLHVEDNHDKDLETYLHHFIVVMCVVSITCLSFIQLVSSITGVGLLVCCKKRLTN